LALEQTWLLADSLKLAEAQYRDILIKQKAGSVSRLDTLSAHRDVLLRLRELRQAQADVATNLRTLFALIGTELNSDLSVPIDARAAQDLPTEAETPTLLVALDPIDQSRSELDGAAQMKFDSTHPQLETLAALARAAEETAASLKSGHGPSIQLSARVSRDYPNGPIFESFQQNTVGVSASWPLFESGRVVKDTKEQQHLAESAKKQRNQSAMDLERDWEKAHDQLRGLLAQKPINEKSIVETEELSRLTYDSYKVGRSSYLEVQTVNLQALEAKVISATNDAQILIHSPFWIVFQQRSDL